jgi:EAL domain-containing protein (putative c-di-GMP-specific phosphodiesterase class I)
LILHFQPRVDVASGAIAGAEALVRWQHPERGLISPLAFIQWRRVRLDDGARHRRPAPGLRADEGLGCVRLRTALISVNVSVQQLRDPTFVAIVRAVLDESGLQPTRLMIEVTESTLMSDMVAGTKVLDELGRLGSPSRLTTSAPATRRSAISTACRCTSSRSIAPFSPKSIAIAAA